MYPCTLYDFNVFFLYTVLRCGLQLSAMNRFYKNNCNNIPYSIDNPGVHVQAVPRMVDSLGSGGEARAGGQRTEPASPRAPRHPVGRPRQGVPLLVAARLHLRGRRQLDSAGHTSE